MWENPKSRLYGVGLPRVVHHVAGALAGAKQVPMRAALLTEGEQHICRVEHAERQA